MISAKVEAKGLMQVPYDSGHYLDALAPRHFPRLLKAIEPDAHEVAMVPALDTTEETHILNIRGAVAGCVPFNAFYDVTYPAEPQPHVKVELTSFANKYLSVTGKFFVQVINPQFAASFADGKPLAVAENQLVVLHIEEWELRRWMILLALPLRIYLKWKVRTEVRRIGEFVARERGRPTTEGLGFRASTAIIKWSSTPKA